jgi:hypothetical protein
MWRTGAGPTALTDHAHVTGRGSVSILSNGPAAAIGNAPYGHVASMPLFAEFSPKARIFVYYNCIRVCHRLGTDCPRENLGMADAA